MDAINEVHNNNPYYTLLLTKTLSLHPVLAVLLTIYMREPLRFSIVRHLITD